MCILINNKKIRLFVILLISFLGGAEVDIFIPSFPELQATYNLSPFMVQLTVSVNFIAYCVCCLFAGTMGDKYNRRQVLLWSLFIFVFGSLACVCSNNFPILLIGRLLQGIGMAGPAVLSYAIMLDDYPPEKRAQMMGILNGIVTLSVAFAPLLGSYISLYFGWRANFIILLVISVICLIGGYLTIPNKQGNNQISLSPLAYLEILRSKEVMYLSLAIIFLSTSYWTFVSMAPILYMESFGVKLEHFGLYQGSICGVFAIVSLLTTSILNVVGQKHCMYCGIILCMLSGILFGVFGYLEIDNPIIITALMLVFAVAVVFPCNILYPFTLNILANSTGRTAALMNALRLLFTAISVEVISYCYNDSFFHLGIAMFVFIMISCYFMKFAIQKINFA